jgi:release factor glutamine methyltransferase
MEKRFLDCRIDFSQHNFSPRIETEFWVGEEIKRLKVKSQNENLKMKILDIFSGTGCIGITILKNIENSEVDFADIWPKAIEQIKINLKLNEINESRYKIYQSNIFHKIAEEKYDFIFANPPYVALNRIFEVQKEVLEKEPKVALFAGKDGLVVIDKFLSQVKRHLHPLGELFMEFETDQQERIKEICGKENLKVTFKKDQFGKIRWLEASVKP